MVVLTSQDHPILLLDGCVLKVTLIYTLKHTCTHTHAHTHAEKHKKYIQINSSDSLNCGITRDFNG